MERRSLQLVGHRFGSRVIIAKLPGAPSRWLYRCDCGAEGTVGRHVRESTVCPRCRVVVDCEPGATFGRLTVLRQVPAAGRQGTVWRCRCLCGVETEVRRKDLCHGNTTSCGCLKRETLSTMGRGGAFMRWAGAGRWN